ncbi:MAG: metallophosphoesterase family protein [Candidatus Thiodiazotropha sp. (ex Myrtea sp. 'scaly one' KF741663)]|nr:metallophosphoesterase family protein [Candidatus Thiodiazotropha sp. (ex Myrtea sp. 'scaly one' KF741663)]
MPGQVVEDLGVFHEPLLIFGGPYGNLQATEAMQERAEALSIPPSRVICNGDSVAYCAQPEETVNTLREWGVRALMGNCEESLATGQPDCGCGFEPGTSCSLLAEDWYRFCNERLSSDSKSWMGELPAGFQFTMGGLSFRLVHGALSSINRFLFASSPAVSKLEELARRDADVVIGGHSGLPFGECLDNRYWLNSGVIGMPANDGTQDGWFLLLYPMEAGVRCEWHRLFYNARAAQQAMYDAGQDNGYAAALTSGYWPSMDVLPEYERTQQGMEIKPCTMMIIPHKA